MRILVLGASGFVGAFVARALRGSGYEISALARDSDKAARLTALGYRPVLAEFGSADVLNAVDGCDGVVNCAAIPIREEWDCIAPLLDRMADTGKPFITTSGTAVLSIPTPNGEWREETFAEDDAFEPPRWIAARVATEEWVRAAAARGVRTMVIRPPMIWGHGSSGQIPAIQQSMRATGQPCYVGRGLNLYSHVHIDDLAELFCLVLARGQAGALYHAVAGEVCWRSIAEALGRAANTTARSVTLDDARQIWGDFRGRVYFGVSSRSRSPRARRIQLGTAPRRSSRRRGVRFLSGEVLATISFHSPGSRSLPRSAAGCSTYQAV